MASSYDGVIDCSRDWKPQIEIQRPDDDTGLLEPYTPITGVTTIISATRDGSTAIHATLSQAATELAGTPGTVVPVFDMTDLRAHLLPTYLGKPVYFKVFKSGELQYEPFRCLVAKDRLGI